MNEKLYTLHKFCQQYAGCEECPIHNKTLCNENIAFVDLTEPQVDSLLKAADLLEEEPEGTEVVEEVNDIVNHPSHYCHGGMECIDEMVLLFGKEAVKHFCLCNAWKYRKRAMYKNGQEDMDKSDWYIKKYHELDNSLEVTTLG